MNIFPIFLLGGMVDLFLNELEMTWIEVAVVGFNVYPMNSKYKTPDFLALHFQLI
jgi:hypothetical protein